MATIEGAMGEKKPETIEVPPLAILALMLMADKEKVNRWLKKGKAK